MITEKHYNYIYGPVNSWRLGNSLGIDLISTRKKTCNFDCIYCQLGPTKNKVCKRKVFVETKNVLKEFRLIDFKKTKIDFITFSGMGEPSLALNLGEAIKQIKKDVKNAYPVAVITNSSAICNLEFQKDLNLADFILFKADADCFETFKKINRPLCETSFKEIIDCMKKFIESFHGNTAIQIMFVKENKDKAEQMAAISRYINPGEIHVNTPLRPSFAKPLSKEEMDVIFESFKGLKASNVYDKINKQAKEKNLDKKETKRRRGTS